MQCSSGTFLVQMVFSCMFHDCGMLWREWSSPSADFTDDEEPKCSKAYELLEAGSGRKSVTDERIKSSSALLHHRVGAFGLHFKYPQDSLKLRDFPKFCSSASDPIIEPNDNGVGIHVLRVSVLNAHYAENNWAVSERLKDTSCLQRYPNSVNQSFATFM